MVTKNKRSHHRRRIARKEARNEKRLLATVAQHADDRHPHSRVDPGFVAPQNVQRVVRSTTPSLRTSHEIVYDGYELLTVGYGLRLKEQVGKGLGLVTEVFLSAGTVITQYEGILLTKKVCEKILKANKSLTTHYCTTYCRQIVIDGWRLVKDGVQPTNPAELTLQQLVGHGGGSFVNHSDHPNAELIRVDKGDGYGVYVKALEDIQMNEFIGVDYSTGFLTSNKSNLSYIR